MTIRFVRMSLLVSSMCLLLLTVISVDTSPLHTNATSSDLNGTTTEISTQMSPWSASVRLALLHLNQTHNCSGVLLSDDVFITVYEFCVKGRNLSTMYINELLPNGTAFPANHTLVDTMPVLINISTNLSSNRIALLRLSPETHHIQSSSGGTYFWLTPTFRKYIFAFCVFVLLIPCFVQNCCALKNI